MIRSIGEDYVKKLGEPLFPLIHQSRSHPPRVFSQARSAAMSIVAHLSYCTIDDEDRANVDRATIIPSTAFQYLVELKVEIDIAAILAELDFANPIVVRTHRFVAIGLLARSELWIGVRGTVGAYDWGVNARILPRHSRNLDLPMFFHSGFLSEATLLAAKLKDAIAAHRSNASVQRIHISGHSLGGAIAAILHQLRGDLVPHMPRSMRRDPGDCYIFGAPRTVWRHGEAFMEPPFAIRRSEDIVPRLPPSTLGYENFREQRYPHGAPFLDRGLSDWWPFLKWINAKTFHKFPEGHSIETYRSEVLERSASLHVDGG